MPGRGRNEHQRPLVALAHTALARPECGCRRMRQRHAPDGMRCIPLFQNVRGAPIVIVQCMQAFQPQLRRRVHGVLAKY